MTLPWFRIFLTTYASISASNGVAGSYVLTFDDAPTCDTLLTGEERTDRLVHTLKTCAEGPSVFYCNTKSLDQVSRSRRLRDYSNAGHYLANHTADHPRLSDTSATDFIHSIEIADQALSQFPNYKKWFRFPYLNESSNDRVKHDQVKKYLRQSGYRLGYVTVETYDWHFNGRVQEALSQGKNVNFNALKKLYVRMILESVRFYDSLAKSALGNSPVHILLMHERDINAWFLKAVIEALSKEGFHNVSAEDGFRDPIAHARWNNSPYSMRRVRQIAQSQGVVGPLSPPWTDTFFIDKMFEKYRVIR